MSKYIGDKQWKTPLSLAVFGPPGTGKSFTIKQILTSVDPRVAEKPLEYNVAQFTEVRDLAQAFHRAQDRALEDEVPLLVFDEFDTDHEGQWLGWLKYFLAPMQDGQFKFGESMYHIGRAIFLFAGGTTETFAEFYDKHKELKEFKDAKGPDFVSRLRGHLNIMPINSDGEVNQVLMFRRAVLLRSLLETHCKKCIDESTEGARIDKEVVRAFLHVRSFKHGIRSMEAIIQMAKLSPRQRLQKSSIAPAHQLGMHVDAGEFLGWVNGMA